MSNNPEFKNLLNTISEFENHRRIQQSERFRAQTRINKIQEDIEAAKKRLKEEEEKEMRLREETKNELKGQVELDGRFQKYKTESIAQQHTNGMFENHVTDTIAEHAKKREDLNSQLGSMKAKFAESHQFWESQDYVKEFRHLEKEYASRKGQCRLVGDGEMERQRNISLQKRIEGLRMKLNELSESEASKEREMRKVEDEKKFDGNTSGIENEISNLRGKIEHMKKMKADVLEESSKSFELLEALGLCFDKKLCLKCLNKEKGK